VRKQRHADDLGVVHEHVRFAVAGKRRLRRGFQLFLKGDVGLNGVAVGVG
jgi:hypothetical protein